MKIGLSYSRCVRDIVDGTVDIDDVLIIIARTDFDPHDDEQWQGIWQGYAGSSDSNLMRGFFGGSNPEWVGYSDEDENLFRNVSIVLYNSGKLHQPRQFGAHPRRLPYYWLETVITDADLENSPAVKDAWDKFQMVAGLTNVKLNQEKNYENFRHI
jgi:hypothetical protein